MHAADLGTIDYLRALMERLNAAASQERGRLIDEAASFLHFSRTEVYRRLHKLGWRSGRKPRADKGASSMNDEELFLVGNLMRESTRANGKRLLSVESALEIAVANGRVRDLGLSPGHVSRLLRAKGLHPEQLAQPEPHVRLATPHPNHTWQIDASVCVLYYLDKKGLAVMGEKEFYKNKPENFQKIERQRVIRYVVTDHYSGACYVEYFLGAEDTENLFNFFVNAISRRAHAQDPLHGVPFQLYDDAGSANSAHLFDNFLKRLQVKHLTHMPGNPRAKGQVEGMQNIIERSFEGRLAFGARVESLEQLNGLAHQWMRWFNGTRVHSRHGHTRYAMWQTIREEQLRIAPERELCRALLRTKPVWAAIGRGLTVRHQGNEYRVEHIPGLRVGGQVEVCVNPYEAPAIHVITYDAAGAECVFNVQPVARNAAGFAVDSPVIGEQFARQPDTATDTARKAMLKQAHGVETLREAEQAKKDRTPAFEGMDAFAHLEAATVASYLARKGTDLPIERPRTEAAPLSHAAAAKKLVALGVAMNPTRFARIRAEYPDGVREQELDRLAALFGAAATGTTAAGEASSAAPPQIRAVK